MDKQDKKRNACITKDGLIWVKMPWKNTRTASGCMFDGGKLMSIEEYNRYVCICDLLKILK